MEDVIFFMIIKNLCGLNMEVQEFSLPKVKRWYVI